MEKNEEKMKLFNEDGKLNVGAICSYHTFIYPFSLEKGKLDLGKNGWIKKTSTFNKDDYSNYIYYNNEGRRLIYSQEEIVEYYMEFDSKNAFYEIEYGTNDNEHYKIPCTCIRLKEYKKKLYLFIIEVANDRYNSEEDIKRINDIGRRLYYPFKGSPISKEDTRLVNPLCPLKLTLKLDDKTYSLDLSDGINDIMSVTDISELDNKIIPSFVKELVGLNNEIVNDLDSIIDERMLITCSINSSKNNEIDSIFKEKSYDHLKSIYEFAYCDCKGSCSFQKDDLIKNEIDKVSYKRWENCGSYYYITTTGFVNVINDGSENQRFIKSSIYKYNEMYYVALMQHMALLYLNKTINLKQSTAYSLYNEFSNLIDFNIITTQIQGVEMFNQMREELEIDILKEKIQEKINQIHNIELEKKTDILNIITTTLTVFVTLASVFSSLAAINYSNNDYNLGFNITSASISLIGALIFIPFLIYRLVKWKMKK